MSIQEANSTGLRARMDMVIAIKKGKIHVMLEALKLSCTNLTKAYCKVEGMILEE